MHLAAPAAFSKYLQTSGDRITHHQDSGYQTYKTLSIEAFAYFERPSGLETYRLTVMF
jgi:hypothetical protein